MNHPPPASPENREDGDDSGSGRRGRGISKSVWIGFGGLALGMVISAVIIFLMTGKFEFRTNLEVRRIGQADEPRDTLTPDPIMEQNQKFLAILDGKLKEQEERLEKSRLKMEKALADFRAGGMGASGTGHEEKSALVNLTQEVEGLREEMRALDVLEAMNFVGCGQIRIQDPAVSRFMVQLAELELADKQAEALGIGLSHPQRRAMFGQIDGIKKLLVVAVGNARETVSIKIAGAEKMLKNAGEDRGEAAATGEEQE